MACMKQPEPECFIYAETGVMQKTLTVFLDIDEIVEIKVNVAGYHQKKTFV